MEHTIVKSSELGDCWSPGRHLDHCEKCKRVGRCKLPEAKKGRLRLAQAKVRQKTIELQDALEAYCQLVEGEDDDVCPE